MKSLKRLSLSDRETYLTNGFLTQPLMDMDFILSKVNKDKKTHQNANIIESIMRWISHEVPFTDNKELKNKYKFRRNAKEILESGFCTGCTDRAILFATIARQLDIPTTLLHTAEKSWIEKCKNGEKPTIYQGHSFCECFFENKWILVDPSSNKIEYNYDCNKIHLSYPVANSHDFIPYFRGLDLGKRQTIKEHNDEMDMLCEEINL